MELSSEYRLNAPGDEIWWVLTHPILLKDDVPGLSRFEEEGPNRYRGEVKVGVSFLRFTYKGTLVLNDLEAPTRYKVRISGGGRGGSVDGSGSVTLTPLADRETRVGVTGTAKLSGMISAAGDRATAAAADKILGQFFKKVEAHARRRANTRHSP